MATLRTPSRRSRTDRLLVCGAATAIALNVVSTALSPWLVAHHPIWLITMEARNRNLVLAAGAGVGLSTLVLVGVVRGLLFDPVFFELGRRHGDKALERLGNVSPRLGRSGASVKALFNRAGWLVILVSPNYAVCTIAGAAKLSRRRFIVLDAASTAAQVCLVAYAGDRLRAPLETLVAAIRPHAPWLTAVSIALVLLGLLRERSTTRARSAATSGRNAAEPSSGPEPSLSAHSS